MENLLLTRAEIAEETLAEYYLAKEMATNEERTLKRQILKLQEGIANLNLEIHRLDIQLQSAKIPPATF